jgi:hypothetical protein
MAKTIETGTFYSILHLRLKKTLTSNLLQGRLGGDERLVHKLNTVNTSNEELQALIGWVLFAIVINACNNVDITRRKEEWKRTWANRAECGQQPHEKTIHPSEEPTKQTVSSALSPPYSTIKDVLASDKCPNTFSVVARVVDYYPLRLNECVVQQCTKCQEEYVSNNLVVPCY